MVNDSPWGSTLANTALRCARAVQEEGHKLSAVFFQGEGVYNAISGGQADAGTADLAQAWAEAARSAGCELLLCSSACARRLPRHLLDRLSPPYRVAGLAELVGLAGAADRVVSF